MAAGPLHGKGEKFKIRLTREVKRLTQNKVTGRKNLPHQKSPTIATPRGDALDKLSMANAIAEWLYFSQLTGTLARESYYHWKLWLDRVPADGGYFKLLSAPEYNNLQGKVCSDFASKLKRKTWP